MFSFTIAEFTFLCAGFAFVGSLILFPSFRQQLKALAGGFLQVFVQDTAKTPDGARAIYAQKIDEMTEKYTDACNTLRDLTGKLKTIQDNYAVCQKQAKGYDERAKAAMSRGDGIIASTQFADVNSWVNAKIGVPEFSEAETLVAWFVNNSNLSDADKATIMNNLIMFGTADDTAKAYFAGQIDVAATWEPYLTQAKTYTNSTVVFDTKSSSSLVMDGIVFDADWAAAHEDTAKKFVKGILMSYDQPINYEAAREVFPMYSTSSDADIDATYANAKMASWKDNYNILNDTAPMIYNQMCDIWEALGETVNRGLVDTIFDTTYIDALKGDFKSTSAANATTKVTVSDETRANITQQVTGNLDYDSMLSKTANVTFVPDSSVFTDQASAASVLDDFVNIAKTLDGTMIVINGNINADTQTDFGVQLSANRAQTVANYLASQGIDQNRLIITGSGNAKYQADKAAGALKSDASVYQSTDISFMRIEN